MDIFKRDLHIRLEHNQTRHPNQLSSVCLSSEHNFTWTQQGVDYAVKGPSKKELYSFHNCYKVAISMMENKLSTPTEMRDKSLYAFSFYYDRLKSAKLIPKSGGIVKVSDILEKALSGKFYV